MIGPRSDIDREILREGGVNQYETATIIGESMAMIKVAPSDETRTLTESAYRLIRSDILVWIDCTREQIANCRS